MKDTVIYHSADFDGIFCREIARKFLPDADLIGWNFGDPLIKVASVSGSKIYVLDLSPDCIDPLTLGAPEMTNLIWIDHHKTSIDKWSPNLNGYRIDGVAACRLAWQWFCLHNGGTLIPEGGFTILPPKKAYIDRQVLEPIAVRLAGEYDIWDKRDPDAELFQHGLRSQPLLDGDWKLLLSDGSDWVKVLLEAGKAIQYAKTEENKSIITHAGFDTFFEGLKFLACNHARFNSHLFTAGIKPEHDALLGFCWKSGSWSISLYHAPGKEHHDLSAIAKKFGGGGHKGACGFQCKTLPFNL